MEEKEVKAKESKKEVKASSYSDADIKLFWNSKSNDKYIQKACNLYGYTKSNIPAISKPHIVKMAMDEKKEFKRRQELLS